MYLFGCVVVNIRICIFISIDIFIVIILGLVLVVDVVIVNIYICKFNIYISIDSLIL